MDGKVAFRLEGDRLTVTFKRPLARRGGGARPFVTTICGADLGHGSRPRTSLASTPFVLGARRDLRVGGGVRVVRARLGADRAIWTNLCGIRWRGREGSGELLAAMRLVRGSSPGCEAPEGVRVESESDRVLVLETGSNSLTSGGGRRLACLKPAGAWRELDSSWWDKYNSGRYVHVAAGGSWAGWTRRETDSHPHAVCSIWRVDLATAAEPTQIPVSPSGEREGFCGQEIVTSPDGRLAWIARDWAGGTEARRPERVNALTAAGAVVTLDVAADATARALRNLAISDDGRSITWVEGEATRRAALP